MSEEKKRKEKKVLTEEEKDALAIKVSYSQARNICILIAVLCIAIACYGWNHFGYPIVAIFVIIAVLCLYLAVSTIKASKSGNK